MTRYLNRNACSGRDTEDLGVVRDALQAMGSKALEAQARARGQVAHCATCEHFIGSGHRSDTCSDMDGHAAPVVATPLAFADVDVHPDTNAARRQGRYQFESAASRLGGAVEEREHAVAGVLGAATPVPQ